MNMKDKRIQANKILKWYDNNIRGLTWLYIFQYLFIPFSIIDYVYTIISSAMHGGYPILSYIICVFFLSCLIASWYCVSVLDKRGYYILQIYLIMSGLVYAYSFTTTLNVIYCIFIFINLLYMIYFFRRRDILKGVFFCLHAPDGSETIMRFDGVPTQDRSKSMKPKFCKYCGGTIDENKKCTGCGKQYFRLPRINVHYAIIAFLILVIVALLYECAILNTRNAQLANGDIWFIKDQQTYKEQCDWYQNVLDNMGIAFVFDDGYYWHRPNCEKVAEHPNLQLYSGTIEEFKDEGYEECPLCY